MSIIVTFVIIRKLNNIYIKLYDNNFGNNFIGGGQRKMKKNNILKKLVLTTITFLLLCNITGLAIGINKSVDISISPLSMQDTVYVNDDYNESTPDWGDINFSTIQDGVNHVNEGGTVIVYNGTYFESVIIKKSVRIIGEWDYSNDSNYPPLVSDPTVAFMIIGNNAKGTYISHFDITGASVAGVMILNSKEINISLNNIYSNRRGIYLLSSSFCNITYNNVFRNTYMGISLDRANDCKILGNWIVNNNPDQVNNTQSSGIDLSDSCRTLIQSNNISFNGNYTIWIGRCNNDYVNIIKENNILDNETTFNRFDHPRWGNSRNTWSYNYYSDAIHGTASWHRYFVRGSVAPGLGWIIKGIRMWQIDSASMDTPYPIGPNEI
jgi:parallel beta-helix repeat protein